MLTLVSIKSLYNHFLAECCYALSHIGIACVPPMPTFLSIEPANICQLRCPQCPVSLTVVQRELSKEIQGHFMTLEHFRHILAQTQGYVHTIQFFFQGEPLLNKDLPEMIRLAHEAHIYTLTSTNAQALTPLLAEQLIQAELDRIIVSMDGLSEQSYTAYRQGGSLHQVLQGLTYLRNAKDRLGGRTHIELQCLRLRSNEHEWDMFRRSYRQMGADSLTFKTAQFYDYEQGNPLMPSDEKYSRYHRLPDGTYQPKNRLTHKLTNLQTYKLNKSCHRLLTGCVITVKGDVLPCCFDKSHRYVMGNIFDEIKGNSSSTLRTIWHSQAFQNFRRQVRLSRFTFPICTNCTE